MRSPAMRSGRYRRSGGVRLELGSSLAPQPAEHSAADASRTAGSNSNSDQSAAAAADHSPANWPSKAHSFAVGHLTLLGGNDLNVHTAYQGNYEALACRYWRQRGRRPIDCRERHCTAMLSRDRRCHHYRHPRRRRRPHRYQRNNWHDVYFHGDGRFRRRAGHASFPAAVALNYNDIDTISRLTSSTGVSNINGNLHVEANHTGTTTETANTGSTVSSGVGAAVALGFSSGGAEATSGNQINVLSGTVSVLANTLSHMNANAVTGESGSASGSFIVTEETERRSRGYWPGGAARNSGRSGPSARSGHCRNWPTARWARQRHSPQILILAARWRVWPPPAS